MSRIAIRPESSGPEIAYRMGNGRTFESPGTRGGPYATVSDALTQESVEQASQRAPYLLQESGGRLLLG